MYPRYTLDIAALSAAPTRIVITAGRASRGYFPHRIATLLAERIGTAVVEFPSHHAGYVSHREHSPSSCASFWQQRQNRKEKSKERE
jgi:hypothetical protein